MERLPRHGRATPWLGALGALAFAGAGVSAVAAAALEEALSKAVFLGLAALGGAAIHRAGQSRPPLRAPEQPAPRTFQDVAGLDEVRQDLEEPAGLSGAHLAAIANEGALAAARAGRSAIGQSDLLHGLERVMAGLAGKVRVLSAEERRVVAVHEAGHAVVGHALGVGVIERMSLLSRSRALGYVLHAQEDRLLHTRQWLLGRIATLLGGRAAEEAVLGDISTGAADDLQQATTLAEQMVLHYGMGERHRHSVLREQTLVLSPGVQEEVEAILRQGWSQAVEIVEARRPVLLRLAEALQERETLEREEIAAILEGDLKQAQ